MKQRKNESLTAAEVADYLQAHPEFFAERDDDAPAHERIAERRIQTLRERQDRQQARLDGMLDAARSNQDLAHGLHEIAVRLLAADSVDAAALVKTRFALDAAAIFLRDDGGDASSAEVDYASLSQRVAHLGSVCDDRVSRKLSAALFPDADAIASCAFIPIVHAENLRGVMVLGAADREHFQPDMGVLILDRLGQLVGAYLAGRGLV